MINSSALFSCPCNQKIDCTQSNTQLKSHIKNCSYYRSKSPMANIFDKLPLDTFTSEQIKAIKAELSLMVEALEAQLNKRELPTNDKNNMKHNSTPIFPYHISYHSFNNRYYHP